MAKYKKRFRCKDCEDQGEVGSLIQNKYCPLCFSENIHRWTGTKYMGGKPINGGRQHVNTHSDAHKEPPKVPALPDKMVGSEGPPKILTQ